MESPAKQNVDYKILGRVIAQAKPYRAVLATATTLAVVLAPVAILRPYLVQVMVDQYIFKYDIPGLTKMALLFVGLLVLESVLRYFFIYASNWVGQAVVRDLRVKIFNHITDSVFPET